MWFLVNINNFYSLWLYKKDFLGERGGSCFLKYGLELVGK